jgi:uncharacterized protein YjbI with pentapeptide repeats
MHQCEYLSLAPVVRAQMAEIARVTSLLDKFSHCYAQLGRVDWSGRDLSGYHLDGAHLDGANLSRANLSNCNLSNAILANADLNFTNLSGANLSGANLCGATLVRANLNGVCLTGVSLAKMDLAQLDADGSIAFCCNGESNTRQKCTERCRSQQLISFRFVPALH